MKHVGMALILFMSIVLTMASVMAVNNRSFRDNEMQNALDVAIENTLDNLRTDRVYEIEDWNVFVTDFLEDLLYQIGSDSEVSVAVKEADIENGLLSIEVTMHFTYGNGNDGHVSAERTVMLEQKR